MRHAYIGIIATAIVVRLIMRPPDWLAALALMFQAGAIFRGLQMLEKKWGARVRPLLRWVLLPLAAVIFIGQVFFAIQEVLPFLALAGLLGGAAWYTAGRVVHMKTLDGDDVQAITIDGQPVDEAKTIAALRGLQPFSAPKLEHREATDHVLEIRYRDGSVTRNRLRRGPRRTWIEFNVSEYAAQLLR